jgi:hypothetical protein
VKLAWAVLTAPLVLAGDVLDRVQLKNGEVLTGRVVFADSNVLVLRQDERDKSLERSSIERVETRADALGALLDDAARTDLGNAVELANLARRASENGLPGEAEAFWWRLLVLDPAHEEAHRALGHRKRGEGWAIPVKTRQVDWAKRLELARDWGSAWELTSLHYALRSNLSLAESVDVLFDLERFLRAFYRLFGSDLGLYDLTRPLQVYLHADRASYPEKSNETGLFDTEADIVHVNAEQGLHFDLLVHEGTHQLLYDTAFRARVAGTGELPTWLDEGLACYVAAGVTRAPAFVFEPQRLEVRHFRLQAEAKKPIDLTRVLSLSVGDYFASSERDLKYAESYSLVHFLLHGGEGRYRAGFLDYLRGVYAGKGSATDLKRALDVDWRPLEEEWNAYARSCAR